MNDLIVALALLSMPPQIEKPVHGLVVSFYEDILREQAISDEVMDTRERDNWIRLRVREQYQTQPNGLVETVKYVNFPEMSSDLLAMQSRYIDVLNCPRVWEARRFPPAEFCRQMVSASWAYECYLDAQLGYGYSSRMLALRQALSENKLLRQCWDRAGDATSQYNSPKGKRLALKELLELLGDDDFYEARMPPPVPFWRFQTIK